MSHQSDLIATDIDAYLAQHEQKELLRFLTCGSVDDGKSTLIGRLLFDSKMIYEDQLAAVTQDSTRHGTVGDKPDLALLMDGLKEEREQGITIDVAYRYFSTSNRKFIIADTPGHEQYTRNMATGASTCDLAIILIDAREGKGVITQTKRHTYIAWLLGIRHIVVAVNKMDLVDFNQQRFKEICAEYRDIADELGLGDVHFVPISALDGDNVVNRSEHTPWYEGQTLMGILDTVPIDADRNLKDFRLPVQLVNRPNLNFRGYCGSIASGVVKVGDAVKVLPSGKHSTVKSIINGGESVPQAFVGQAVTLTLNDEIDISRGDMLVHAEASVELSNHLRANLIWMNENPMKPGREYLFKFTSKLVSGQVSRIDYSIDVNTREHSAAEALSLNDIAEVEITLHRDVVVESYRRNRTTGAFIVIDRLSNTTVGAGMVIEALPETDEPVEIPAEFSEFELELNALVRKHFPHWGAVDLKRLLK